MKLKLNKKQILILIVLFCLILILPLAISLTRQKQEIRKRAKGTDVVKVSLYSPKTKVAKGETLNFEIRLTSTQEVKINSGGVDLQYETAFFTFSPTINCGATLPNKAKGSIDGSTIYLTCGISQGGTDMPLAPNQTYVLGTLQATVNDTTLTSSEIKFLRTKVVDENANDISDAGTPVTYTIAAAPTDERVVGRVLKGDAKQTGYSITSNDTKSGVWGTDDQGPWYYIGNWAAGSQISITLNNPDSGYTCRWSFDNDPDTTGTEVTGNGCTAAITIAHGLKSTEWQNHLQFYLVPAGATATPTPTTGATGTPTPTTTVTPGNVKLQIKIKFGGVTDKPTITAYQTQQVKILIRNKNDATKAQNLLNQNVVAVGDEGIFQLPQPITLSSAITVGNNYYLLIKGPKHLQTRYCSASGQNRPCEITLANIPFVEGETVNTLDFTGYPLLPGDLPTQNGVVDSRDGTILRNCAQEYLDAADKTKVTCVDQTDLNFDGLTSGLDQNIMNDTIYTRWDDQ